MDVNKAAHDNMISIGSAVYGDLMKFTTGFYLQSLLRPAKATDQNWILNFPGTVAGLTSGTAITLDDAATRLVQASGIRARYPDTLAAFVKFLVSRNVWVDGTGEMRKVHFSGEIPNLTDGATLSVDQIADQLVKAYDLTVKQQAAA